MRFMWCLVNSTTNDAARPLRRTGRHSYALLAATMSPTCPFSGASLMPGFAWPPTRSRRQRRVASFLESSPSWAGSRSTASIYCWIKHRLKARRSRLTLGGSSIPQVTSQDLPVGSNSSVEMGFVEFRRMMTVMDRTLTNLRKLEISSWMVAKHF